MKKSIALITAALLFSSLCACGEKETSHDSGNYIYGQISSISGNDVTLLLAEYTEPSSDDESADTAESASDGEGQPSYGGGRGSMGGGMPQGGFDRENMPEGFDPENMPEGGFDRENMPEGMTMPDGVEMPNRGGFSGNSGIPNRDRFSGNSSYTLTGEKQEIRIPVGVTVKTALGVETDFDVLETGDMIKCSVETDSEGNQTVTAVWIVE